MQYKIAHHRTAIKKNPVQCCILSRFLAFFCYTDKTAKRTKECYDDTMAKMIQKTGNEPDQDQWQ
jgi:hypothetical protein